MIFILIRLPAPPNHDALVLYSSTADDDLMAWNNTLTLCVHECMCVCVHVCACKTYPEHRLCAL